jgi:hypothetical protein
MRSSMPAGGAVADCGVAGMPAGASSLSKSGLVMADCKHATRQAA